MTHSYFMTNKYYNQGLIDNFIIFKILLFSNFILLEQSEMHPQPKKNQDHLEESEETQI